MEARRTSDAAFLDVVSGYEGNFQESVRFELDHAAEPPPSLLGAAWSMSNKRHEAEILGLRRLSGTQSGPDTRPARVQS